MTRVRLPPVDWTDRQLEAATLLKGGAPNVLLYGGSRSGKTRYLSEWIVRACRVVPGLRVLVLRYRRIHAKDTIWHETLLGEVLPRCGFGYEINKSDLMIEFSNGSEIWVGGTDDQIRLEKMLGRGAGLAYLNEVSQISYAAHTLVRTRLSQKLVYGPNSFRPGKEWTPRILCDCNPPSPTHWTHRIFIDHVEPRNNKDLDPDRYVSLRINPIDNLEHLPRGYMDSLDELPDQERRRFKDGEWTVPEGAIFPEYGEHMLVDDVPDCEEYIVGVDLVTYAAVLVGIQRYTKGESIRYRIYCIDEWSRPGALAHDAEEAIESRWRTDYAFTKVIDHNLGKAGVREFAQSKLARKGQGSVEAGIVQIQSAMHNGEFFVHRRCKVLHYELENYHRDEVGAVVKQDDHHTDALRMVIHTKIRKRREIQVA